ncbi:MAG: sigma-70 family RNA polymerase sigma factor [Planctomycetota bacterium]|jgi:RNA polymerase sigma factor for flagellar operon FliA
MTKRRAELAKKWLHFKKTGDEATRHELIEAYLPLARHAAERLKGKLPMCVDIREMISAGAVGLIDAVDKFDPARGILFETYCSVRIRGAILDDLRSSDWVPRAIREKAHHLDRAKLELAFELGREPEEEEIAERMGLSAVEFEALLKDVDVRSQLSIEGAGSDGADDRDTQRIELIEDRSQEQPLDAVQLKELREIATRGLSDKEQRVMSMYYFDGMTMKEIGAILGISESRVCQVHSQIIKLLRQRHNRDERPGRRAA